jgi:hypothetical protein
MNWIIIAVLILVLIFTFIPDLNNQSSTPEKKPNQAEKQTKDSLNSLTTNEAFDKEIY